MTLKRLDWQIVYSDSRMYLTARADVCCLARAATGETSRCGATRGSSTKIFFYGRNDFLRLQKKKNVFKEREICEYFAENLGYSLV